MTRTLLVTLALALTAPAAQALTQLELAAQRDLREYGFKDVNVEDLSPVQLAAITHLSNLKGPEGSKRGQIRSILGGPNNLRGLLLNQ